MSTMPDVYPALHESDETNQADAFAALEQRVVRMVELLRTERRERARAEETSATLQQLLDEQGTQLARVEEEKNALSRERDRERDHVRGRVERILEQLDDLG